MRKYIVAISLGLLALGLSSCHRNAAGKGDDVVFTVSGTGFRLKSSESGFASNDILGIFAPDMEQYNIKASVAGGSKLVPDKRIRWKKGQKEKSDFYAYFPYDAGIKTPSHTFTVASDQTGADSFLASDLSTAHASAAPPSEVAFVLEHRFSRISFNFSGLSGGETISKVVLKDVFTQATVDLGSGTPSSPANKADVCAHKVSGTEFVAILIPQAYLKAVVTTSKGRVLEYCAYSPVTMESGYAYQAALTVPAEGHDTSEIGFSFTIVEWDGGGSLSYGEPSV